MSVITPGPVSCSCSKCQIIVADKCAVQYFRCGCEDCRQAAEWASSKGGMMPDQLPHLYYISADIISIRGKEFMNTFKLREDGASVRLYCTECWSLIAVDHPVYQSNVFLIFPKYCKTDCDLSVPLTAIIFMKDYPENYQQPPEDDVPLFYSFVYDKEMNRFAALPTISNTFKQRTKVLQGINLTSLIGSLGLPKILNLKRGQRLI